MDCLENLGFVAFIFRFAWREDLREQHPPSCFASTFFLLWILLFLFAIEGERGLSIRLYSAICHIRMMIINNIKYLATDFFFI